MDEALRALNRFGLGARPGERGRMRDPKGWLLAQLDAEPEGPPGGAELAEIGALLRGRLAAQRAGDQSRVMELDQELRTLWLREAADALSTRFQTETPFVERLVAFWSNHFCVSAVAGRRVRVLAGHYERTAIRPHVLGRFDEMVLASAQHPAMLFYLDNFESVGPSSVAASRMQRRGAARGLNENYARELLELHTVGVDGGYEQVDIEALASVLTGWGVTNFGPLSQSDEPLAFVFRAATHEPGPKTVMARRYSAGGADDGEQVIRDLCAHPSTAAHVARKLVTHFIADEPPPDAVAEIAATFQETDGDLRAVARALIDLDEAWHSHHRKFRTPQDWVIAVFRALRVGKATDQLVSWLDQLRHPLWSPAAPNGYGDLRREWADPDSLLSRAELARSLVQELQEAQDLDPWHLLDVIDEDPRDPISKVLVDESIPAPQRLALAVSGPAFQWR